MKQRMQQRGATGSAEVVVTPAPSASPTPQLDALTAEQPDLVDRIFDYVVELVPAIAGRKTEIKGALRDEFGAQKGYIRRREQESSTTARLVLSMFNGRNKHEIARRLDISLSQVHRIIKQSGDNSDAQQKLSQVSLEMRQVRR